MQMVVWQMPGSKLLMTSPLLLCGIDGLSGTEADEKGYLAG